MNSPPNNHNNNNNNNQYITVETINYELTSDSFFGTPSGEVYCWVDKYLFLWDGVFLS